MLVKVLAAGFNGIIHMLAVCHSDRYQIHEHAQENALHKDWVSRILTDSEEED